MSSLSQKDKNTLIIAGIALLIVGIIVLGIKPAFTSIQETRSTNEQLKATKQTMKTEIEALPTYKTNLSNAIIDYNKTGSRVFDCQTNDKIHDAVVEILKKNGFNITSLSINSVTEASIADYAINDEGTLGGVTEGTVKIADVSVSFTTSSKGAIKFIDYLNATEGTYLDSFSFSSDNTEFSLTLPISIIIADSYSE